MSAENPQVGETWELYDPAEGRASQAVIVELTGGNSGQASAVRLMNRLGRSFVVPVRSFLLTWRYVYEAVTHPCWYDQRQGCSRRASLQVNDPSGWVWVCDRHLPAGRQALLPFDRPEDRDNLTASETQCPRCNTAIRFPGSSSERDPDSSVTIQRCGRCGSHWVLLMGRGDDEDGVSLCEQINEAAEALHGRAINVRAIVGFASYRAIRDIIRPSSSVAGTPVQQGPGVGANNVVVIGDRPQTGGVRRLGGAPGSDEPMPPVERRPLSPLTPAVGSIWQEVLGGALVEVVDIQEDRIDRELVVFQAGLEDRRTLPVREFLARFNVNVRPRHPMAEPPPPTKAEVAIMPGPRAGDTWWQITTGRPSLVVAVETDEDDRHHVRLRDVTPDSPTTHLAMDEFVKRFSLDPPDPGCAPGEEWTDDVEGAVLKISEVKLGRREVVGTNRQGQRQVVPLALFMTRYRRVIRRSVYERLLEDDDGDDDPSDADGV